MTSVTADYLQALTFSFQSPFQLPMADEQCFIADEIVRILPKRRLVAFGHWQGRTVVAKLFFDKKQAERHWKRELSGITTLNENKIPTPALLYHGVIDQKRLYILLFERLHNAQTLDQLWKNSDDKQDLMPTLQRVITEIATQHVLGITQHDMHLNNFLISEKTIYTLDAAAIQHQSERLAKKNSMDNLALFLSQFGVGEEARQETLFHHYVNARGWLLKENDKLTFFFLIKKWQACRLKKFHKKMWRNSSHFAVQKDWRSYAVYDRRYANPELMAFLADPEALFQHQSAVVLKAGRSSTVIKIKINEMEWVIKRYNIKNIWHRLRRLLRHTRAYTTWQSAQKLILFGIATAKPIAFVEQRTFALRGKSYAVTEYVSALHAGDFFAAQAMDEAATERMVQRIATLIFKLAKVEMTHGDLKISNILIDTKTSPTLIDLDGMLEHRSRLSLEHRQHKEIQRFLANFRDRPSLQKKFLLAFQALSRKNFEIHSSLFHPND